MSSVIEFQVQVTDGVIFIPEQYKKSFNPVGNVRVILIQQDVPQREIASSAIDSEFSREFLDDPALIANFAPLTRDEIYEH